MTNNNSRNTSQKLDKKNQKPLLIPLARVETPSSHQHTSEYPHSSETITINEQNMRPREVSNPQLGTEVWSSVEDLFWDHMKEVQNKWSTLKLNDDIWAKLIYFEQNRRLAKAYVSAPVLTIDGSANGLDGFRIGLSGIDNTYRSLSSTRCLRSIGQGVKLKIDNKGNILIRKVANGSPRQQQPQQQQQQQQVSNARQCSIWVKDWPGSTNSNQLNSRQSSENLMSENCLVRELEKSDVSYKLFDMRKFRLQLEKKRLENDPNFLDWRQCVSIISFVRNNNDDSSLPSDLLLQDPCWIMLINIIAIDMLKSSIICDRDDNSTSASTTRQLIGSSNLIHQHALLESTNSDQNNRLFPNNELASRSYSSASILSPVSASTKVLAPTSKYQSYSNNNGDDTNNTNGNIPLDSVRQMDSVAIRNNLESENNLILATSDRIKKSRTSNNRYRMSPSKSGSYYHKYQSTQQLSSANSTIYTTFNSKFINSKQKTANQTNLIAAHPFNVTDNSSTSDYNSVSRSTSSGNYWPSNQQSQFYQIDSLKNRKLQLQLQRHNMRYHDEAKLIPGQSFLTTPLEPKGISLSAFDLSLNPFDMKSAIKMNYDEVDGYGHDDHFGYDKSTPIEEQFNEFPIQMQSRRAIVSLNNQRLRSGQKSFIEDHTRQQQQTFCCYCDDNISGIGSIANGDKIKKLQHVNLKECLANQNKQLSIDPKNNTTTTTSNNNKQVQPQKTSRSSIDSSSSSSGCADNDYFISQSSSSMSSSTESNERESYSQQTSGSGIACSGNTSDEYDDNGGQKQQIEKRSNHKSCNVNGHRSLSPKNLSVDDLTKKQIGLKKSDVGSSGDLIENKKSHANHKKGSRNKSLGTNGGYCCDSGLIEQDQDHHHSSNSSKESDCDCPSIEVSSCNCCCDCFVDNQPPRAAKPLLPSSSSPGKNALQEDESIYSRLPFPAHISTNKTNKSSKTQKNENTIARMSPINNLSKNGSEDEGTIPNVTNAKASSRQSNGSWLEKRRYSKILPKFIFSSSSNNGRQVRKDLDKNTQRKSNTLDRGEKFTLFKSTYEL